MDTIMLKTIFVFVFFCSFEQNNAFVIPNAEIAGFEAESSVSDHQLQKKSPQSFFPDFPFEPTSSSNNNDDQLPFPENLPQFGMQFSTNGLESGLSTGYDIPFQSGNMINPIGKHFRDLAQDMFNQPLPPNGVVTGEIPSTSQNGDQQPVFKTESFNVSPEGQQLYENGQLVENIPNEMPNTQGLNQNPSMLQNPIPQGGYGGSMPQPNTGNIQQAINPGQVPVNQAQQPNNPSLQGYQPDQPKHSKPIVKVSSAGASSSTLISSTNNQPPEMSQSAGAYNYKYDSTQPNPVNGAYMGVNGYTPNMYDPNQGNYQYTHGTFPNTQNMGEYLPSQPNMGEYLPTQPNMGEYLPTPQNMGGYSPNPFNPNQNPPHPSYPFPNQIGNQNLQPGPNQQHPNPTSPQSLYKLPNQFGNQNPQLGPIQQHPYQNPLQPPYQFPNQDGIQNLPQVPNQQQMFKNNPKFMQEPLKSGQNQYPYQPPNYQNYMPQGYPTQSGGKPFNNGHYPMMPDISQQISKLNGHLGSMGMPHIDPSAVITPFSQLMQSFPNMMRNAANQGLEITKIPFDMSNAALDALNKDLNKVRVNEFVQIPTEVGRAVVGSIEEMINQFQRNLMTAQPVQRQAHQQTLARRSPEPWLPNFDTSQMSQYFTSVPFSSAQAKLQNMKNDIYSKIPTPQMPSLNQMNQPFNYFSQPQMPQMQMPQMQMPQMQMPQMPQMQMPKMPQFPKPSANGEPVVKYSSSSVSESSHSSSVNGAPPEVSYKAAGSKYDYDSTKDNRVQADILAMGGYTPDASDPSKGKFVAYEKAYP